MESVVGEELRKSMERGRRRYEEAWHEGNDKLEINLRGDSRDDWDSLQNN